MMKATLLPHCLIAMAFAFVAAAQPEAEEADYGWQAGMVQFEPGTKTGDPAVFEYQDGAAWTFGNAGDGVIGNTFTWQVAEPAGFRSSAQMGAGAPYLLVTDEEKRGVLDTAGGNATGRAAVAFRAGRPGNYSVRGKPTGGVVGVNNAFEILVTKRDANGNDSSLATITAQSWKPDFSDSFEITALTNVPLETGDMLVFTLVRDPASPGESVTRWVLWNEDELLPGSVRGTNENALTIHAKFR